MKVHTTKIEQGKKYPRLTQYHTLAPWQEQLLKDINKHPERVFDFANQMPVYQQGGDFLSSILSQSPEAMKAFEAPAMRQFNEQILPAVLERVGAVAGGKSSALNQAIAAATTDLTERLAALRGNLGLQAAQTGLQYAQLPFQQQFASRSLGLTTQPFGYLNIEPRGKGSSFAQQAAPGVGQGAGMAASYGIMELLKSLFSSAPAAAGSGAGAGATAATTAAAAV